MSGIVGIVHLDGQPVDPPLLRRMTDSLAFRGPDAQEVWFGEGVAFGHAMLRTTRESNHEHQPHSLDGQVWITSDARIDDRQNLIDKLRSKGRVIARTAPDLELLLHAYHVWGKDCVEHLLGDFVFAIWDNRRKRVFCARDQLGIKQFYYFHSGSTFVFSNTLNCIRLYSEVACKLNDRAIADFLLFDLNQDLTTTTFADIHRIPPAHTAILSSKGLQIRRYWSLPVDEPIYYKRSSDYVERFKELLTIAVRDRVRTPWIGIFMSGGIDSPTLAAATCQWLDQCPAVTAFTYVFDGLIPHDERYYSGLVSSSLGIPIHYRILDDDIINTPWCEYWVPNPEPRSDWLPIQAERRYYHRLSQHGRVFFDGEGVDNAMRYEWLVYILYLTRQRLWGKLLTDVLRHVIAHRRVPLIPSILRILADHRSAKRDQPQFPPWLNEKFASQFELRSIWRATQSSEPVHPVRPRGHASFGSLLWQDFFGSSDSGLTEAPLEIRYPYLDLRLLRYMLAVPALPWCRAKHLLRRAMQGTLPHEVLRRPKAPLATDPLLELACRRGMKSPTPAAQLFEYVNPNKISLNTTSGTREFWSSLRPIVLNSWLIDYDSTNSKT